MNLPTVFRGCMFDEGWKCDAPCVVYFPFKYRRLNIGSNIGGVEFAIEEIQEGIIMGDDPDDGGLDEESEARGWNVRGFSKRKNAWHLEIRVRWRKDEYGELEPVEVSRREQFGPFATKRKKKHAVNP